MNRLLLLLILTTAAFAQWTGSGSSGVDGALNIGTDTPGVINGVFTFDPVALNLDLDGDNIFHFTTITVRDNITVKFRSDRLRHPGPVVLLASGAVAIQGRLNLDGENGHAYDANESVRRPSIPGPGGYPGGAGAKVNGLAQAGFGPGGGRVATPASFGCPAGFVTNTTPSWCTGAGAPPTYGNNLLQPLVGGSGGSGTTFSGQQFGAGGGAGGGAIRISSSVAIVFGASVNTNGSPVACSEQFYISVDGGAGGSNRGGPGTGGAVYLQAPVISGCTNHVYARGGFQADFGSASAGRVRFDANNIVNVTASPVTALPGPLVDVPLPSAPARIRITSINNVLAPANPGGGYTVPDVTINSPNAVPVVVAASNIPINTPVTLFVSSEAGQDVASSQVNLNGTLASSTATINVTLPQGVSRLLVRAVW